MRAFSLSLAVRDWLLHVWFLSDRTGSRVLVDGFHFERARSFVRGWALPRPSAPEGDECAWQRHWYGGMCNVSWQQGQLGCRLTIFRCFQLSVRAEPEPLGRWLLAGDAVLERLSVPGWPAMENVMVGLVGETARPSHHPGVILAGGGLRLGVSQGAAAAGIAEHEHESFRPLQFETRSHVEKTGSPIAHLGSVLHDDLSGSIDFFPTHAGRGYHRVFPQEKGQLVYGEFDGIWHREGGGEMRLCRSRGVIDTRVLAA